LYSVCTATDTVRVVGMPNVPTIAVGGSTAFLTVFGLLGSSNDIPIPNVPVKKVNVDGSMLSKWLSDDLDHGEPLDSECQFYNNTVKIDASACTLFTISRSSASVFQTATERAVRCASKANVECILSVEIGFSIPVAFIADQTSSAGMVAIVAPKITASADEKYVRVSVPPDGLFESATTTMNNSVSVEYMDDSKHMKSSVLKGNGAFCVQLLRRAYDNSCWSQLDD